jgi:RNA polymerase sigma factor (sigma-70 family)
VLEQQLQWTEHSALVLRIQRGDLDAEHELVNAFSRSTRIIIRRIVVDQADQDDLFQDVFCLILQKIRAGDPEDPARLPGFISGLARNQALMFKRKPNRTFSDEVMEMADPEPSPLQQLLQKERADLAAQTVAELPLQRDREILYHFYILESPKADLCKDFQLSPDQLNRVLSRARQRYHELVTQKMGTVLNFPKKA